MDKLITTGAPLYAGVDVLAIIIIICLTTLFWLYRTSCGNYVRANIKAVVVCYIAYLLADIVWVSIGADTGVSLGFKYMVNGIYFAALGLAAFFWFRNVCMDLGYVHMVRKKSNTLITAIPVSLLLLLSFSAQYNNFLFSVDPVQGYRRGPWFAAFIIVNYGYIIAASVMALCLLLKKRGGKSSGIIVLVIYCLPIIFAGFLQIIFGGNYQAIGYTTSLCIMFVYKILYDSLVMMRVIQSVTSEYSCVYLCDPAYNRITPYRVDEGFYGAPGSETAFSVLPVRMHYDAFLKIFLANYVSAINADEMSKVMQLDYIHDRLAAEERFEKLYINEKGRYCSLYMSWVGEGESAFVLAIADKDDEIKAEAVLKRKLLEANRLANTDALTGVRSATAYAKHIAKLDAGIKAGDAKKFAIVECDINSLKAVNDACGHDIGDVYIKNSALIICNVFTNSPVFRTGGDEFVIILTGRDYENRIVLIEHLRSQVTVPEEAVGAIGSGPSIAAGMSRYHPERDSCCLDVFRRADAEMYKNKKSLKSNHYTDSGWKAAYMAAGGK